MSSFFSNLEHTLFCWLQPSCHRRSFGRAELAPNLVPTACSQHGLVPPPWLGPSIPPAAYKPQLAPSCCLLSLSLGHRSHSRFGNQAAWRNLSFSLVTFPYSTDIFPLIWETRAMGDLLGGFACWVKVLLLQTTSCELNRERQGGRKSHC